MKIGVIVKEPSMVKKKNLREEIICLGKIILCGSFEMKKVDKELRWEKPGHLVQMTMKEKIHKINN